MIYQYFIKVDSIKEKMDWYCDEGLVAYRKIVDSAKKYEDLIGWNFASYGEYNGIIEMSDGYLTSFEKEVDMTENAESVIGIDQFCKDNNTDFLYIQAPYKISKYDDTDISGKLDFSNQNADSLLNKLSDAGVETYDLREVIHEEGFEHHKLFFRTDHHWLLTTGLWAAGKILKYCNDHYDYSVDLSVADINNFNVVEYPKWFLGSQGKKVTLSRTTPDDFSLLYPKEMVDFHYVIPSKGIDEVGEFSITYDMDQVDEKDYYGKNPYGAYNYGDQPLIQIENRQNAEERKVLLIKDSFSDCVSSFLALGLQQVEVIDLRYFEGSLQTYMDLSKPDLVILMYNPSSVSTEVDWNLHTSLFDFR